MTEPDHLKHVARLVWPKDKKLVRVLLEILNDEKLMIHRVADRFSPDSMLER